jgi:hypothetical protein
MFSRLWQTGSAAPRDPASIKLAAATLAVAGDVSAQVSAVDILEKGRRNTAGATAAPLAAALAEAYFQAKQYDKLLAIADDLVKQLPQSQTAVLLATRAAYAAGGQKEGRRVVETNIGRFDQEPMALRTIGGVAMPFGDVETSAKLTCQIIDSGRATPGDYNQIAWGDLMAAKTSPASVEAANQGVLMMGNRPGSGLLHTLAAVEADSGKETEARAVLLQRMERAASCKATIRANRRWWCPKAQRGARRLNPAALEPTLTVQPGQSDSWVPWKFETKFLRLFRPAAMGDRINGWSVCWIGGWDKCRVLIVVMVERPRRPGAIPARKSQEQVLVSSGDRPRRLAIGAPTGRHYLAS